MLAYKHDSRFELFLCQDTKIDASMIYCPKARVDNHRLSLHVADMICLLPAKMELYVNYQ